MIKMFSTFTPVNLAHDVGSAHALRTTYKQKKSIHFGRAISTKYSFFKTKRLPTIVEERERFHKIRTIGIDSATELSLLTGRLSSCRHVVQLHSHSSDDQYVYTAVDIVPNEPPSSAWSIAADRDHSVYTQLREIGECLFYEHGVIMLDHFHHRDNVRCDKDGKIILFDLGAFIVCNTTDEEKAVGVRECNERCQFTYDYLVKRPLDLVACAAGLH
jgi:hypothetical protein